MVYLVLVSRKVFQQIFRGFYQTSATHRLNIKNRNEEEIVTYSWFYYHEEDNSCHLNWMIDVDTRNSREKENNRDNIKLCELRGICKIHLFFMTFGFNTFILYQVIYSPYPWFSKTFPMMEFIKRYTDYTDTHLI